jgi:hypothetical protein
MIEIIIYIRGCNSRKYGNCNGSFMSSFFIQLRLLLSHYRILYRSKNLLNSSFQNSTIFTRYDVIVYSMIPVYFTILRIFTWVPIMMYKNITVWKKHLPYVFRPPSKVSLSCKMMAGWYNIPHIVKWFGESHTIIYWFSSKSIC